MNHTEEIMDRRRANQIYKLQLDTVAEYVAAGYKQHEIALLLGVSDACIFYRKKILREEYPELLKAAEERQRNNQ